MNILSIDWDYFIDCTEEDIMALFPDGRTEEISMSISILVWASRYGSSKYQKEIGVTQKELLDINVRKEAYGVIKATILEGMHRDTSITITESHKDIYSFIKENCSTNDEVHIYNVDHHCDCYNMGSELNCGNWVNKLDQEGYVGSYTWIMNDGETDTIPDDLLTCKVNTTTDIGTLFDMDWDLIFICRSSIWSPPHLDHYFNELYDFFKIAGITFNKNFFLDRFKLIEDRLQKEYEISKILQEQIEKCTELNKNCDCTPKLEHIKKLLTL